MDVQQNEAIKSGKIVEDSICLFEQFVSAVSSDALKDIRPRSKFSTFVRDLCVKAPSVAQYLVQEILNHLKDDSQPEIQGSQVLETSTNAKRSSKRRKPSDRSYRPLKSFKTQSDIPKNETEDSHEPSIVRSQVGDELITCQSNHGDVTINQSSDSLMTNQPLSKFEEEILKIIAEKVSQKGIVPQEEVMPQEGLQGRNLPSVGNGSALHQLKATYSSNKRNAVHKQPSASLGKPTEDTQTTISPLPSGVEPREIALLEIDGNAPDAQASSAPSSAHETEPKETALLDPTPSTLIRHIDRRFQSPLSDDQTATLQTALFTPIVNREAFSPLTEDDRTASSLDKVEMTLPKGIPSSPSSIRQHQTSLCNITSAQARQVDGEQPLPAHDSQAMLLSSPLEEAPTLTNMVAKVVHLMYEMSRRQEVPTKVHSKILSTLQSGLGRAPAILPLAERPDPDSLWITSSSTTWSTSMWINILEAGHARSKEVTILNMIEWMGASE